jgi:hypothetical protein
VEADFKRYAENEKEALLWAARLLDAEGWCQRESIDGEGRRCVTQALSEQIGLRVEDVDASIWARRSQLWRDTLRALIAEPEMAAGVGTVSRLIDWNDAPGRTQDDVVSLLRRVASKL